MRTQLIDFFRLILCFGVFSLIIPAITCLFFQSLIHFGIIKHMLKIHFLGLLHSIYAKFLLKARSSVDYTKRCSWLRSSFVIFSALFCTFSAQTFTLYVHSVFDSLWVLCWSYWPTSATGKLWKQRSLRTTRGDHTIYGLSTSLFLCPHSQNLDIELLTWALKTGPIERRTRNSRSFGSCKTIPKKVNLKVGRWGLFEIRPFYSVFLMRKPLSKGRKWLLRP